MLTIIMGKTCSGKTTIAKELKKHGFRPCSDYGKRGLNIEVALHNKPVFIINGGAGVGKDTFVEMCGLYTEVLNYSSVDKVKEIARLAGWDGSKDEKSRKFLSDLKVLTSEYNDMPFNAMQLMVNFFMRNNIYKVMFLHIREPEEIDRAKKEFDARSLLIIRDSVKRIESNMADAHVYDYDYDFTICNNGTFDDLSRIAKKFLIGHGII